MESINENGKIGTIIGINGPIITVKGFDGHCVGDMVEIGEELRLIGEIIKIKGKDTIIQCYEETEGLTLYDKVLNLGYPLSMELGPGMLNTIYDGIQRPLKAIEDKVGPFIARGIKVYSLDRTKKWEYKAILEPGTTVSGGTIVGSVQEFHIEHKIMVPPGVEGELIKNEDGVYKIEDEVFRIRLNSGEEKAFPLYQRWPIRRPRPFKERFMPKLPLITGLRVFDFLFPIAKGGTVAVPGGFGTGKTVVQHTLAKFSDADIIVYIGCGERGNEMADLVTSFPKLNDPINNRPLMERTVMIANTSNMPVSAREASIYSGITIAEYWRDQGYDVLLLADSTSRWAEALRELSGRLEEMPTEGGYPAYLSDKLSSFYERAGRVLVKGSPERYGSISVVGAVSPQGGDFSEPVTKTTKQFVKGFWALDARLAYARHYPSVNWTDSYSLYADLIHKYWEDKYDSEWMFHRKFFSKILSQADELEGISQLIGKENMSAQQQLIMFTADLIKEGFLIQNAFNDIDQYSSPEKTIKIAEVIIGFYKTAESFINSGVPFFRIKQMDCINEILRMRLDIPNDKLELFDDVLERINKSFEAIKAQYAEFLGEMSI